jgi:hypothetical protein
MFIQKMTALAMALMFLVASNVLRVEATPANRRNLWMSLLRCTHGIDCAKRDRLDALPEKIPPKLSTFLYGLIGGGIP